jgi:hypothetical protein
MGTPFDAKKAVVIESIALAKKLIILMRQLDAGEINGIMYGLPDVPLAKQTVFQLLHITKNGTPRYEIRILNNREMSQQLKFTDDHIGNQDAFEEFVDRCASRKAQGLRHLQNFPGSEFGIQSQGFELFAQKTLEFKPVFTWAT